MAHQARTLDVLLGLRVNSQHTQLTAISNQFRSPDILFLPAWRPGTHSPGAVRHRRGRRTESAESIVAVVGLKKKQKQNQNKTKTKKQQKYQYSSWGPI